MRNALRQFLRTRVLPDRGIRRAHIIGCARSGTTMLHYAMAAFEKVSLHQVESNIRYTPSICQSLALCRKPANTWLVTKREFGWFKPAAVADIIELIIAEKIALINVVRDPRDVLVSRHAGNNANEYYVDPGRWKKSVAAGQEILDAVSSSVPALTLRYEDIVMHSEAVVDQLVNELGMIKNPDAASFSQLEDTMSRSGTATNPWMEKALHSVRNFDQNSIGRWQHDEGKQRYLRNLLNARPELHRTMIEFMKTHHYEYAHSVLET